jgi:hypothetical protein
LEQALQLKKNGGVTLLKDGEKYYVKISFKKTDKICHGKQQQMN